MARVGILVDGDSLMSDKYISLWDLGLSWQAITETWQEEKIQFKTQNLTEEVSNAAVLIIFSFLKRLIMGPLPNPWPKVYWTFEFSNRGSHSGVTRWMNPLPDIALHTLGRAPSPGLPPDVDIIINSLTDNLGGREWARQGEYSAMISYRNRRVLNRK